MTDWNAEEHRKFFAGNFLPLLLSSLAFTCFSAALRNRIPNLVLYASSSLTFLAVYFVASLAGKSALGRFVTPARMSCLVPAASLISGGVLLLHFFREARPDQGSDFNGSLFRYQIPAPAWLLLLACTMLALYLFARFMRTFRSRPLLRLLISLPYICLLSCTVWIPNIFYSHYIFFHAHPYFSSIYDVLNLAPLGELDTPLYGHYALFFLLPCKLMQLLGIRQNIAAATMLAFCNVVTLLAVLYAIHKFVKNDGVFLIALFSLGDVYLMYVQKLFYIKDVYLQTIPHRVMFPALACALMAAFAGKELGKGKTACLYVLAALSFLWNPETGLVCMAAVSLYVFLSGPGLRKLALCAALSLASILADYLIVLAYDFLTSGQGVSFRSFMYPMMGQAKGIAVQSPMPDLFRTWLSVTIFLLAAAGASVLRIVKKQGGEGRAACFLCMAVLALGLLSYFMNNPVQLNLTVVFFQVVILLAVLLDFLLRGNDKNIQAKVLSIPVLAVMATFFMGNMGMREVLSDRRSSAWGAKNLSAFVRTLDEEVPGGTLAFGWGVSDLFAAMDRDPSVHVLDWVNIMYDKNPVFLAHVNGLLEQADSFFAFEDSVALLPAGKDFAVSKEFEYKGWKFALYTRK